MIQLKNKNKSIKKVRIKPQYLRSDEKINAIDYLEKVLYFIDDAKYDLMASKWVVIASHNALYAFAICACADIIPDLVAPIIKKGKNKGKRQLISFNKALKYCKDPKIMNMLVWSETLALTVKIFFLLDRL
jgi:hypothetical protein